MKSLYDRIDKSLAKDKDADTAVVSSMATEADSSVTVDVRHIPVDKIYFEDQFREVNQQKVESYAASFRDTADGQPRQPVYVWANPDGRFLGIIGEHRCRAQIHNSEIDQFKYGTIIARVHQGPCPEGFERDLIQAQENLLREDPKPIEVAIMVKKWIDNGDVKNKEEAAKKLHETTDGAFKSGKTILSQAFAIMDDDRDADLVEQVKNGEIKLYKAKQLHSDRLKERKAEEQANREAEALAAQQAELERKHSEKMESLQSEYEAKLSQVEKADSVEEAEQLEQEAQVIKETIENEPSVEEVAPQKEPKKKPADSLPQRFSVDYEKAEMLLEILNAAAKEFDLEEVKFDPERITRAQFDSVMRDRVHQIYLAIS